MYVDALAVTDFRSYADATVAFEPGVNVLVGPNGQGKTNLVEAIGYLASLGSHRVASDGPLVRAGAERAYVRAGVVREGRRTQVEVEINPGKANRARVNRAAATRAREVLGLLRSVLFAPEDLALVKGDPAERRRFLDELLVARAPRYAAVRSDYDRVLRQRNALLKSAAAARRGAGADLRTLDVWDGHLARTGAVLTAGRLALVDGLGPLLAKAYDAVSDSAGPAVAEYRSGLWEDGPCPAPDTDGLERLLAAALERSRPQELDRGLSLVGPHRDELLLTVGALPARGYASHGESWSLALALRLASYDLLRDDGTAGGEPVLVLDDVFAELDDRRRDRLAELVGPAEQVLVTAAVPADVPAGLGGARFEVAQGQVRRVG